jgi:hypothetical protein
MCRTLKQVLLTMLLAVTPGLVGAWAATTAAQAAPATASAALTVTDTVAQIGADEDLQRAALARLEQTQQWRDLARRTAALEADFDRLEVNKAAQAELVELLGLEHRAWALRGTASAIVDELSSILERLEQDRSALEKQARMWQERLSFLSDQRVPARVLDRARGIETTLKSSGDRVREARDSALLDFVRAFTLHARIVEDRKSVV